MIYNGGMLMAPLRYFDAKRQRSGLPPDVAALVTKLEADRIVLKLVNLDPITSHEMIIQAGTFGEHFFTQVGYSSLTSAYPGTAGDYAAPDVCAEKRTVQVDSVHVAVELPPASEIDLKLDLKRFVNRPSSSMPWD